MIEFRTLILTVILILTNNPAECAFSFLKRGIGARAAGMGGAFTAISDDASALYWNPAGIGQLREKAFFFEYNLDAQDIWQGFGGYVHPLENWVIGGSINYLEVREIERRIDASEKPIGTFKTSDLALGLSVGKKIRQHHLGATLKYLQEDLYLKKERKIGVDIGWLRHIDNWSFGISLSNIFGKSTISRMIESLEGKKSGIYGSKRWEAPLILRIGGAYEQDKWRVVGEVDVESSREEVFKFHLGGEWEIASSIMLRAGLEEENLSFGIGFKNKDFNVDYAYIPLGDLGDAHRLSLIKGGGVRNHPPKVELIAPKGGEKWEGLQTIIWKATDEDRNRLIVEIEYKEAEKERWKKIKTDKGNGGRYNWDTKEYPDGKYQIKVRVIDIGSLTSEAQSGEFTIDNYTSKIKGLKQDLENIKEMLTKKKELLEQHKVNLSDLRKDEAVYPVGGVPQHIKNQIRGEEERIRKVEEEIRRIEDEQRKIREKLMELEDIKKRLVEK